MKYIKKFNIFESKENNLDVKRYVEDILLEVNDASLETDVVSISTKEHDILTYNIQKTTEDEDEYTIELSFDPSIVIDTVESIHSYLTSIGYSLNVGHVVDRDYKLNNGWIKATTFEELISLLNKLAIAKRTNSQGDMIEMSTAYSRLKS